MADSVTSNKLTTSDPEAPNANAFVETQFRQHSVALEAFVRSRVGDADVARDIVNDVFVRILRMPEPNQIGVHARAYLFTIAVNLIKDWRRRGAVRSRSAQDLTDEAMAARPVRPDEQLESAETMRRLAAAFAKLDERRRRAFQMSRMEDRSYAEIACELGVSLRTVERYMCDVLACLRRELED